MQSNLSLQSPAGKSLSGIPIDFTVSKTDGALVEIIGDNA